MLLLSGNSNRPLAEKIAKELTVELGSSTIGAFSDGETFAEIHEPVRGREVYVIQPTSFPANNSVMELLIMIDALRRANADKITAVIPYFGYARQDRKSAPRTPITSKLVADMIQSAGAHRVITLDLHANQLQGFFNIPVDNLYVAPVYAQHVKDNFDLKNSIIVSPDVGAVTRSRQLARRLNMDIAIIDKRRERAGVSEVMNIIGSVEGKHCIISDDIVDTAGTLCNAAAAVLEHGALSVSAYITHGVLSGAALGRVKNSCLKKLVVSDTIQIVKEAKEIANIEQLSIAPFLAKAIKRIHNKESVSDLF